MPVAVAWLLLLLIVAAGAAARIAIPLRSGLFDGDGVGLLRADPGLLDYLLQRVLAGGGWPPSDFAADPRLQHPTPIDCWSTYTVGQELLLGWWYPLFADGTSRPWFCVVTMAVWMSLTAVGVYLLARELSGRRGLGVAAAALFALLPGAYRSIGFVLVREDFSLPLVALCLGLMTRLGHAGVAGGIAAGASFGLAAATWHATGLIWSLLGVAVFVGAVVRGFPRPSAAIRAALLTALAAALLIPALRAKAFACSPALAALVAVVLAGEALNRRPTVSHRAAALLAATTLAGMAGLGSLLRGDDLSHVWALLWAKLRFLGTLPDDPNLLSVDVRMMWQGPFASMSLTELLESLGVGLVPIIVLGWLSITWLLRPASTRHAGADPLAVMTIASVVLAALVDRLQVLPALLAPAAAAVVLGRLQARTATIVASVGLVVQASLATVFLSSYRISWHDPPTMRAELRSLVDAVRDIVPAGEAVLADPVDSTAILAHTGRPICVQPKWETESSRRRVADLWTSLLVGTTTDVVALMRRLDCRWLVVDRYVLWGDRYIAGVPRRQALPTPGTAAARFFADDVRTLASIPGFELVYVTPSWILDSDGRPSGWIRMFRLRD